MRKRSVDRILAKHELYCTVCENNTGDCNFTTRSPTWISPSSVISSRESHTKKTSPMRSTAHGRSRRMSGVRNAKHRRKRLLSRA
ncbi:hypothetical protein [Dyella monticola]|uniref:hypothetical protein n=1 Tax=Dyella monticola TaxID=1927958 RepID=UPI002E790CEB|nr:hypothetical protein [Dyella monticola]